MQEKVRYYLLITNPDCDITLGDLLMIEISLNRLP